MKTHRATMLGGMTSGLIRWTLLIIGILHLIVTKINKTLVRGI